MLSEIVEECALDSPTTTVDESGFTIQELFGIAAADGGSDAKDKHRALVESFYCCCIILLG